MKKVQLKEIAHARSGDKGNIVNIGVFAKDEAHYQLLLDQMTAEKVKHFFQALC